jgi:hypothetical protein
VPINTTAGAISRPEERAGHTLNTSRAVEEDLTYEDEEPEIISVLPATGWTAVIGEDAVPLVAFVGMDSGRMYGVVVGEDGRIALTESVEDSPGFTRYEQANTNATKEK